MKIKPLKPLPAISTNILCEMAIDYRTKVPLSTMPKVTKSTETAQYLRSIWNEQHIDYREDFIVLMLNRANRIFGWVHISSGGMAGTVADPKIIFSHALLCGATSIILAHNHPSGMLKPSETDIRLTQKLTSCANMLDIAVLDHIILSSEAYLSMADEGMM